MSPQKRDDLDVSGRHLTSVPRNTWRNTSLRVLNLFRNEPCHVARVFRQTHQHHRYLYLHGNRLQVLSDSVTLISATIRSVDFPFRWAPHQIRRARPGKYRTKTLLRFLANLAALDELTLRNNRLSSLPDSFENLWKLCHLDLRRNEFTTFSEVLRALPKLHKLDLRWSVCRSNLGEVFRAPRFPGPGA